MLGMKMNNQEYIYSSLKTLYPSIKTFLNYKKDYEFLFAVILSAQTTDIKVNEATDKLFKHLPSLELYNQENINIIINDIKSLGLYKAKSKNLVDCAEILINKYNGVVPNNRKQLMMLPGVGIKTSGVVLNELYGAKYFPVDTHINRVAKRIGIVKDNISPEEVEDELEKYFKGYDLFYLHHAFILLGRNICKARNYSCSSCPISKICKLYKQ